MKSPREEFTLPLWGVHCDYFPVTWKSELITCDSSPYDEFTGSRSSDSENWALQYYRPKNVLRECVESLSPRNGPATKSYHWLGPMQAKLENLLRQFVHPPIIFTGVKKVQNLASIFDPSQLLSLFGFET